MFLITVCYNKHDSYLCNCPSESFFQTSFWKLNWFPHQVSDSRFPHRTTERVGLTPYMENQLFLTGLTDRFNYELFFVISFTVFLFEKPDRILQIYKNFIILIHRIISSLNTETFPPFIPDDRNRLSLQYTVVNIQNNSYVYCLIKSVFVNSSCKSLPCKVL